MGSLSSWISSLAGWKGIMSPSESAGEGKDIVDSEASGFVISSEIL